MYPTEPKVVHLPADNQHKGGQRLMPPRVIVLHHTGGNDSRDWLTTTSKPPVSIHALIAKNGTIYHIVPDTESAWHAGFGYLGAARPTGTTHSVNAISLGIELENLGNGNDPYPGSQIDACAWQIATWWKRYGWIPIVTHGLIDSRKTDPINFGVYGIDLMQRVALWMLPKQ